MRGFIVYATYSTIENETIVQLFGRLENGQSFVTLNKIEPYFFIRKKDKDKLPKLPPLIKIEEGEFSNFENNKVIKLLFKTKSQLDEIYRSTHGKIKTYEADIRPQYRFIIDKNLLGSIEIDGEYESAERIDRIYKEPEISPADFFPKLKIISVDTEWDKSNGKLFCIGIYAENYKKNFMICDKKLEHSVSCKLEEECLEKFKEEIIKLDPDIIIGWNVIDFDFVFLQRLFKKYKIKFDIGKTNVEAKLRIEKNFFRASSMDVSGRQVLDGLNLIKDPFIKEAPPIKHANFESLTLEDVSQGVLERGKMIKGSNRHNEIEKLYEEHSQYSLQKLVDYNLLDCELVYKILEKTKIIELAIERSKLTGLPLDRLTASIAAFDSLYIREARKKRIVSPNVYYKQKEVRIKGGYVQGSKPGVYNNVLVLDFKSLYPSIIRTFNIDPASYVEKAKNKNLVRAPNGALFINQEGILPEIIEKLHAERERAKKEKKELANHAIKTIMNSFFGVLASPNCRYFNLKIANAITYFGQFLIKLTAEQIEKKGYKVIYSDTDSVFVEANLGKVKANLLGKEIQDYINEFYETYVKKNYNRKSFLELEFEKQYIYLMIPKLRAKETEMAAKKRYAGLVEKDGKEELEIIGLEAIRGDWTQAAQEFQKELLLKLFHKEKIEQFIREYTGKILSGKLDDKLIYRKSIRKELSEYTKTTPPHVKAARKLEKLESNVIEYYITTGGPEPIQKLKHKIDYEHYIEKQIQPIANQILSVFNKEFKEIKEKSKQSKLF